jgi:hypothetical protein
VIPRGQHTHTSTYNQALRQVLSRDERQAHRRLHHLSAKRLTQLFLAARENEAIQRHPTAAGVTPRCPRQDIGRHERGAEPTGVPTEGAP